MKLRFMCVLVAFVLLCGCGAGYPTREEMRTWSFEKWLAFESGSDGFITLDRPIDELSERELAELRDVYQQEIGGRIAGDPGGLYAELCGSGVLESYPDVYVTARIVRESNRLEITTCGDSWEFRTAVARVLGSRWKVDYAVTDVTRQKLQELAGEINRSQSQIEEKYGVRIGFITVGAVVTVGVDDPSKVDPRDFDPHVEFVLG